MYRRGRCLGSDVLVLTVLPTYLCTVFVVVRSHLDFSILALFLTFAPHTSYWGYASTYLTLYFSVRARALASFLSAICGVAVTTLLGVFLDSQRWSLATRARVGGATVVTLFSAMLVWAVVVQKIYTDTNPGAFRLCGPAAPRTGHS